MSRPLEEIDDHNVHARLRSASDALVVLTSPFCGACRAMLRALAELSAERVPTILVADVGESPGLAADLEVHHLPALFLFRDGALHRPIEAPPRAPALLAAVVAAREAPPIDG